MSDKEIIMGFLGWYEDNGHQFQNPQPEDVDRYLGQKPDRQESVFFKGVKEKPHPLYWEQNHTFEA